MWHTITPSKSSGLTFDYNPYAADENFYTDVEIAFAIEDMPVFVGDEQWTVNPKITEHVNKLVLSADLANSLWLKVLKMVGDDTKMKLPELTLELLGSGGRRMDLFDTIRSLTGKDVPDITIVDLFNAVQYTDGRGYKYSRLVTDRDDSLKFDLPRAAYTLDYAKLAMLIPDTIIDTAGKVAVAVFFTAIGWDDIDVGDMSDDPSLKYECKGIRNYVDERIIDDNKESYPVPTVYIGIAAAGISVSVIVLLLIWRRII